MDEIVWVVNPRNDTLLENLTAYLSHYRGGEYFQNTPAWNANCDCQPGEIPYHYPLVSWRRGTNLFLTFEEALKTMC